MPIAHAAQEKNTKNVAASHSNELRIKNYELQREPMFPSEVENTKPETPKHHVTI
jgi:hypothetical protein